MTSFWKNALGVCEMVDVGVIGVQVVTQITRRTADGLNETVVLNKLPATAQNVQRFASDCAIVSGLGFDFVRDKVTAL